MSCRRLLIGMALWGCLCAASAPAKPSPRLGRVQDIEAQRGRLEARWRAELVAVHGGQPVPLVRCVLQKAVANRDLGLVLLPTPKGGRYGWAWADGVNNQVHALSDYEFPTTPTRDGERLRATIPVLLRAGPGLDTMEREFYFAKADQHTVMLHLTFRRKNGKLVGRYQLKPKARVIAGKSGEKDPIIENPFVASEGELSGTFRETASIPELFSSAPPRIRSGDTDTVLLGTATRIEQEAEVFYQGLRIFDMIQRHGIDHATAKRNVHIPVFARPTLDLRRDNKQENNKDPRAIPSLDNFDLDMGAGDDMPSFPTGRNAPSAADEKRTEKVREAEDLLATISARLNRMADLAEQAAGAAEPVVLTESLTAADPDFGPWFGDSVVETREDDVNVLPDDMGSEGPQDWVSVCGWKAFNPLPLTRNALLTPLLPDFVVDGHEVCLPDRARLHEMAKAKATLSWQPIQDMESFGYVGAKKAFAFNPYSAGMPPPLGYKEYSSLAKFTGSPYSTGYLRCWIESPRDMEVWAGFALNQEGRLWVNDRLVWAGPPVVDPIRHQTYSLLRLPLVKGRNEVMVRLDSDFSSPYLYLRLCRRGAPRSAAAAKAAIRAREAKRRTLAPPKTVGWRGNGTGLYPDCDPPVAWDRKTMQNVLWYTPLPYWGNATAVPVPGSDRVIVTMEPHWVICLDKQTGKILWKKAVTLMDLLPKAEREEGWALHDAWWKARQELDRSSPFEPGAKVQKWMRYEWYWAEETGIWKKPETLIDEREGASPKLIALLDQRDEIITSGDPERLRQELGGVERKIDTLQTKEMGRNPNTTRGKHVVAERALRDWLRFLKKHSDVDSTQGYWYDYTGYTFATPVTDGKHIWIKNGMDVAACLDLDGNELWKVQVHGSGSTDSTTASPLLVDGKMILSLNDNKSKRKRATRLLALDAATGETVWDRCGLPMVVWGCASPAVLTLTDGREVMNTVLTSAGAVVRVDDGAVLVRDCGARNMFDSPIVSGDTTVFGHGALVGVQFLMTSRDRIGYKHLWTVRGGAHGTTDSGGAIIVDDRVYLTAGIREDGGRVGQAHATSGLRAFRGPREKWKSIEAYDMATGQYAVKLHSLRKGGNQYTPASASKRHIYQLDGDHIFTHVSPKHPMDIVVIERGPDPLRLANNAVGRLYGTGALDEDRIYIRSYGGLACIGYTGEAGRRYEAKTVARNLMDDIYGDRPRLAAEKVIPVHGATRMPSYPHKHERSREGHQDTVLMSGEAPGAWWMLGPLPADQSQAALKAMGGAGHVFNGNETNTINGVTHLWGPLTQRYRKVPGFKEWKLEPENFTDISRLRRVVQLEVAIQRKAPSVSYLLTSLHSKQEQTFRFEQPLPGVRAWIGGVPVAHGDRLKIGQGFCQLLLEVRVEAIPEQGIQVSPRFWESGDVEAELAEWTAAVKKREPYLRKVMKLAPESPEAKRAEYILGAWRQ